MTEDNRSLWALRIEVIDCAGALTSVSAAFSNSAINIDTISGCGKDAHKHNKPSLTVTFNAEESQKKILLRKIERLTKVVAVEQLKCGIDAFRETVIELSKQAK